MFKIYTSRYERSCPVHKRMASEPTLDAICYPTGRMCSSVSKNVTEKNKHKFEKAVTRFQRFYQAKHSGRKLNWLYQLSKGEVKANYARGSKTGFTFQVSTYQIGVLLQYNTADTYTFTELATRTELASEVLKQVLTILVKSRVLNGEAEETINPNSKFALNFDFKRYATAKMQGHFL